MLKSAESIRARLLLTAATSVAAVMAAAPAIAQDTEEEEADEIVVTGIRKSIGDSIAAKRDNTSIVEAISAEDIGKLPDVSIAESLARLPGLAAQRLNGRAQVISVRGLAPDFTTTLLNGREQVSTSDNRSAEFDQYPSELISQAIVYKTPDAGLIGQGLAGTVDLRTANPLSIGERKFTINARGELNELGALNSDTSNKGYRASVSYFDQFFDDTVGIALGYSHLNSPSQSERFNAWGYAGFGPTGAGLIGGVKPYVQSTKLNRDGFIGILQWEPSDRVSMSFEGYYSQFDELQTLRGIELPLGFFGYPVTNAVVDTANNFVTSGTMSGVEGVVRNDANKRDSDLLSLGWSGEWNATERLTFKADVAYSAVDRTDIILETNTGTGPGQNVGAQDVLDFVSSTTGTFFSNGIIDYSDPNQIFITSSLGWGGDRYDQNGNLVAVGGQVGFLNKPSIEDDLYSYRISAKQDLGGAFSALELGVNYNDRQKSKSADEFYIDLAGTVDSAGVPTGLLQAPIPSSLLLDPTNLDYLGLGPMVTYDPFALIADTSLILQTRNFNADVQTKSWSVNEEIITGWVKFDIDTQLGAIPVKGNIGTQIVSTDQSSTGFRAQGSAPNVFIDVFTDGDNFLQTVFQLNAVARH